MTKTHDRLVEILTPAFRDVRPAGELATLRGVREAVTEGGEIKPGALLSALPWQPRDFSVNGTVPVRVNAAQQYRVRQASRLVYLDALVKTAPSRGPLTIRVRAGGRELENVSIPAGRTEGTSTANAAIPAGSLLTLQVSEANGAADLTVTAWLVPDTD